MPRTGRRALLAVAAPLLAAPCAASGLRWPAGTVRIVSPFPPGGDNDSLARLAAGVLQRAFGARFVVENRPGGGGSLGMRAVAGAAPDGQSLVVAAGAAAVHQALRPGQSFDLLRDFAPVTLLGLVPKALVVHPATPAPTARAFAVLARGMPGAGIAYGSAGTGTLSHLAMALLLRAIGAQGVHRPSRGTAEAMANLVAGRVPVLFASLPVIAGPVRVGEARALAISIADPHPDWPDLPTVETAMPLPGFEVTAWQALLAPAGTPPEILEAMATALRTGLTAGAGQATLRRLGAEPRPVGPREMRAFLAAEVAKWAEAVRITGAAPG